MPRLQTNLAATSSAHAAAYDECRRIARSHYENFPVGSFLIPKRLRPHFYALYAFMRTADDFADLPERTPDERLRLLSEWRENLRQAFTEEIPSHAIFLALQNTIRRFSLAREPFEFLLDAFEFDASAHAWRGKVRFETYEDLHWYTRRSAEPVGQLVLALFGYHDEERISLSNDICTALQLINFMQDAKADLTAGRCYFPREDMTFFGLTNPEELLTSASTAKLVLYECDRIERMLDESIVGDASAQLPELVSGRLRYELRAVLIGARMMLQKIRALGGDTIRERPSLSRKERRMMLIKALV